MLVILGMYFRKDESEDKSTYACTNSTGTFVAAIVKQDEAHNNTWAVYSGDPEEEMATGMTLEEAFDYVLTP